MKHNIAIAAAALLGSANAAVHHMKLEKVPLETQFVGLQNIHRNSNHWQAI